MRADIPWKQVLDLLTAIFQAELTLNATGKLDTNEWRQILHIAAGIEKGKGYFKTEYTPGEIHIGGKTVSVGRAFTKHRVEPNVEE